MSCTLTLLTDVVLHALMSYYTHISISQVKHITSLCLSVACCVSFRKNLEISKIPFLGNSCKFCKLSLSCHTIVGLGFCTSPVLAELDYHNKIKVFTNNRTAGVAGKHCLCVMMTSLLWMFYYDDALLQW